MSLRRIFQYRAAAHSNRPCQKISPHTVQLYFCRQGQRSGNVRSTSPDSAALPILILSLQFRNSVPILCSFLDQKGLTLTRQTLMQQIGPLLSNTRLYKRLRLPYSLWAHQRSAKAAGNCRFSDIPSPVHAESDTVLLCLSSDRLENIP